MTNESRRLQNWQHLFGGTNQILLMLTGTFTGMAVSGTLPWYVPTLVASGTFILGRLSSENSYRTTLALFKENKK
ncbi:MAG: hypothetical protein WA130_02150 [Candidatus Methanoperedens sp.]